jgi:phosphotransferase system HPr (HPr) family protein
MVETSLEEVISEGAFVPLLEQESEMLLRLARTLVSRSSAPWTRRDYYQLSSETDALEAFLDDHGSRHNRAYHTVRELVACARGFALAGFSVEHLYRRLDSYKLVPAPERQRAEARVEIGRTRAFVQDGLVRLLEALAEELARLGVRLPAQSFPEERFRADVPRPILPRNLEQEEVEDEQLKIAEVASRYLEACAVLERLGVRRIDDTAERERFLAERCSEEQARVHEATVHNLQSMYDTWIKGTTLEAEDERLPVLRGHASAALHLLQAVTHLTHFVERHEGGARHDASERRIARVIERAGVREVTLNALLLWAVRLLLEARGVAADLLPSYTDMQSLEVELVDELTLHARPAALIVSIVNHHGTPVQMEVEGHACNAGSILELMIAVGPHPGARRFNFRGDVNPLRDIRALFDAGLGEHGLSSLPEQLGYLRQR